MSVYTTNSDTLFNIAEHIRAKGGTTAGLIYPDGFITAIDNIQTGASIFAFAIVTYESGNTIVCTNNTTGTTITPISVNGTYVYELPNSGTYVFQNKSGSLVTKTYTLTVATTDRGKSYSINMKVLYIVKAGVPNSSYTLTRWIRSGSSGSATSSGGKYTVQTSSSIATTGVTTKAKVPITGYSTLTLKYSSAKLNSYSYPMLAKFNDNSGVTSESAVYSAMSGYTGSLSASGGTATLSVSGTTQYLGIGFKLDSIVSNVVITDMYLT